MAATRRGGDERSRGGERSPAAKLAELVGILALAIVLAFLIQLVLVKTYRIPSGSMEPTLEVGQRVLVNRIGMNFGDPGIGDIVVFHPPAGAVQEPTRCAAPNEGNGGVRPCSVATAERSDETFIKRVVGVGGDRIAIRDGRVIRNGRPLDESFIADCGEGGFGCDFPGTITVPEGRTKVIAVTVE